MSVDNYRYPQNLVSLAVYRTKKSVIIKQKNIYSRDRSGNKINLTIKLKKPAALPRYTLDFIDKLVQFCYYCYDDNVELLINVYNKSIYVSYLGKCKDKTYYDLDTDNPIFTQQKRESPLFSLQAMLDTIFNSYTNLTYLRNAFPTRHV